MANPLKLLVSFAPDGQSIEQWVPMTDEEYATQQADEAASEAGAVAEATQEAAAATTSALALGIADKLDNDTATPAEQRQAVSLCLRALYGVSA